MNTTIKTYDDLYAVMKVEFDKYPDKYNEYYNKFMGKNGWSGFSKKICWIECKKLLVRHKQKGSSLCRTKDHIVNLWIYLIFKLDGADGETPQPTESKAPEQPAESKQENIVNNEGEYIEFANMMKEQYNAMEKNFKRERGFKRQYREERDNLQRHYDAEHKARMEQKQLVDDCKKEIVKQKKELEEIKNEIVSNEELEKLKAENEELKKYKLMFEKMKQDEEIKKQKRKEANKKYREKKKANKK